MVNTIWNQRASLKLISVLALPIFKGRLGILHHCISIVNYRRIRYSARPATRHLVPNKPVWIGILPELVKGFIGKIDGVIHSHNHEHQIATGISVSDLEIIIEAWDLYVESKPGSTLESTKACQNSVRLPKNSKIPTREHLLAWKMDFILECRRMGRAYNQPSNSGQSAGMGIGGTGMDANFGVGGAGMGDDVGIGGADMDAGGHGAPANLQEFYVIPDDDESSTSSDESSDSGSDHGQSAGMGVSGEGSANIQGATVPPGT
ncbi:hypothetical protein EYC80_006462 [Monilinia laxa]|uniref:Uncharacterized protein n=1 Tax=Monilinia laxa TaxID=61186 RepID=A0A5N6JS07_MONLA|nr:hypothetical protein EYC80_006462 [Monilinia laxa]